MRIYRVSKVDIDEGKIGKVWSEKFFRKQETAKKFLDTTIKEANASEDSRGCTQDIYKYRPDFVEGVPGYACWMYSVMYVLDIIEISD